MSVTKLAAAAGRKPAVALVLQGGGALGAYHIGAYQALAEHSFHPDWVCGISIGAINATVIAGTPPSERVARLAADVATSRLVLGLRSRCGVMACCRGWCGGHGSIH